MLLHEGYSERVLLYRSSPTAGILILRLELSSGTASTLISILVRLEHSSCRVHSRRGSGRGLYANVDQYSLSGRGHVTPLDQ